MAIRVSNQTVIDNNRVFEATHLKVIPNGGSVVTELRGDGTAYFTGKIQAKTPDQNDPAETVVTKEYLELFGSTGDYVVLAGDDTQQVITGTGGLKTDGILSTESGLFFTGGGAATSTINTGFYKLDSQQGIRILSQTKECGTFGDEGFQLPNFFVSGSGGDWYGIRGAGASTGTFDNHSSVFLSLFNTRSAAINRMSALKIAGNGDDFGNADFVAGIDSRVGEGAYSGELYNLCLQGDAPNLISSDLLLGATDNTDGKTATLVVSNLGQIQRRGYSPFKPVTGAGSAFLSQVMHSDAGEGIGIRSVVPSGQALDANCPRILMQRCETSASGLEYEDDTTYGKIDRSSWSYAPDDALLGELAFGTATANPDNDIYYAQILPYKRPDGGQIRFAVRNDVDDDYRYLDLNSDGGLSNNYFSISIDSNDNAIFSTPQDQLIFSSATGDYGFESPDYGADLEIDHKSTFSGLVTAASIPGSVVDAKFGIKSIGTSAVTLSNNNGVAGVDTDGRFVSSEGFVTFAPDADDDQIGLEIGLNAGASGARKAINSYRSAPSFHAGDFFVGGTAVDLGDNSNINLLSSGLGEFTGGVKVSGGSSAEVHDGIYQSSANTVNIAAGGEGHFAINGTEADHAIVYMNEHVSIGGSAAGAPSVGLICGSELTLNATQDGIRNQSVFLGNNTGTPDCNGIRDRLSVTTGKLNSYAAFRSERGNINFSVNQIQEVEGFSIGDSLSNAGNTSTKGVSINLNNDPDIRGQTYSIHSAGNAPSYFAGPIEAAGGITVNGQDIVDGTFVKLDCGTETQTIVGNAAPGSDPQFRVHTGLEVQGGINSLAKNNPAEGGRVSAGFYQLTSNTQSNAVVGDGMAITANDSLVLISDGEEYFRIDQESGRVGNIGFGSPTPEYPLTFRRDWDDSENRYCDFTPTHSGTRAQSSNIYTSYNQDGGAIDRAINYHATSGAITGQINELIGYYANGLLTSSGADENVGFWGALSIGAGNNFNFKALGDAPNFFKGNTYIGGTPARNTVELWKSTLTDEQLEQYAAGTLVAPANVGTPGDGSYVRQWYYDQQDAETQALLDSGELDYPTHLAAATFTDTFDLGDNTSINLKSNGIGDFGGIRFINSLTNRNVESRGIVYSSVQHALLSVNNPDADGDNVEVFLARVDPTSYDSDGNRTALNCGTTTSFKADPPLGSNSGVYGTFDSYRGFHAANVPVNDSTADWTGADNCYGFMASLASRTVAGKQTYNFYAAGAAPNYFKGDITCDGLINGAFSLRMETDDPAAFQTTYSTDEDGNQVEQQTYVGTTEDLLSIIKDLRARVAALEAA